MAGKASRTSGVAAARRSRPAATSPTANDPVAFAPPPLAWLDRLLAPSRCWHRPCFAGLAHLRPDRPALYVGNHTLLGLFDTPHLIREIYALTGRFPRALGDRAHFAVPGWRRLLLRLGCVPGTREDCSRLMRAGQSVLVFPGGAREVFKRKGEAYHLMWKERLGFVEMAIQHGYPIVPFAAVGAEEAYRIVWDAEEMLATVPGRWMQRTGVPARWLRGGEGIPPLVLGWGPSLIPNPERFYFSFGEPVATRGYRHRLQDRAALLALRERVRHSIETQLDDLRAWRAADPARTLSLSGALDALAAGPLHATPACRLPTSRRPGVTKPLRRKSTQRTPR